MFKKLYAEAKELVFALYAAEPKINGRSTFLEQVLERDNNLSEEKKVDDKEDRSSSGHTS
jgi:hypothetical protein